MKNIPKSIFLSLLFLLLLSCQTKEENIQSSPASLKLTQDIFHDICPNYATITEYTIPNNYTSIGEGAFIGCQNLQRLIIHTNITEIEDYAFFGCANLEIIDIPDSVLKIGDGILAKCTNLKKATIGNGIKNISDYTFYRCTNLQTVILGKNIAHLGNAVFYACSYLGSLTIYAKVPPIFETNTFYYMGGKLTEETLYVLEESIPIYEKWLDISKLKIVAIQ